MPASKSNLYHKFFLIVFKIKVNTSNHCLFSLISITECNVGDIEHIIQCIRFHFFYETDINKKKMQKRQNIHGDDLNILKSKYILFKAEL